MAYAASVSFFPGIHSGAALAQGRVFQVTIAETEGAAASEATIDFAKQRNLRVLRVDLTQSAGSAGTFNPRIGPATDPSGYNGGVLVLAAAAASPISEEGGVGSVVTTASDGKLYHRSVPNAGSDNTVTVKYWFEVL